MRHLLLMRHAKSDWNAGAVPDHERPLNTRGIASAKAMGVELAARGLAPDLVISSTAVRARTTAELASESGSWPGSVVLDRRLYGGGVDTALSVAAEAPDIERLMLVGHQPTWSMLVAALTGEPVDVRTADVVAIDLDVAEWSHVSAAKASLNSLIRSRDQI